MDQELQKAIDLLDAGNFTCVLCKDAQVLTETSRGVRPLIGLLDRRESFAGFCAADKVVGKAAAFLYCLLGIRAIYARIISAPAIRVLESAGIQVHFERQVPAIQNRTNTGLCPMETAVWDLEEPEAALAVLRETLKKLTKENT